jgi:hypothetical protein
MSSNPSKLTADQFSFNDEGELVIDRKSIAAMLKGSNKLELTSKPPPEHREVINISIVISITKS